MRLLKDVISVLYEPDGCMSLPRLVFFANFVLFATAVLAPQIGEDKASLAMSSLGITGTSFIGNKLVTSRRRDMSKDNNNE